MTSRCSCWEDSAAQQTRSASGDEPRWLLWAAVEEDRSASKLPEGDDRIRASPQPRRVEGLGRGWKQTESDRRRHGAALGPAIRSSDTRRDQKTVSLVASSGASEARYLSPGLEKRIRLPPFSLPCILKNRQSEASISRLFSGLPQRISGSGPDYGS